MGRGKTPSSPCRAWFGHRSSVEAEHCTYSSFLPRGASHRATQQCAARLHRQLNKRQLQAGSSCCSLSLGVQSRFSTPHTAAKHSQHCRALQQRRLVPGQLANGFRAAVPEPASLPRELLRARPEGRAAAGGAQPSAEPPRCQCCVRDQGSQ